MKQYLSFLGSMTLDLLRHGREIGTLAQFEYRLQTNDLFLGKLWNLLRPLMQIGVYWLVFGLGLRNGAPIDGVPYLCWLTSGVVLWGLLNTGILHSSTVIYSKAQVLVYASIPTYWLPVSSVLAEMKQAVWDLLLLLLICLCSGWRPTQFLLYLPYLLVCLCAFLTATALLCSVLVLFARDFQRLIAMGLRFCFFLSPVFWKPNRNLPVLFQYFDLWNPFAYLLQGGRYTLFGSGASFVDPHAALRFWCVTLLLYALGALLQKRIRRNLLDFL